MHLKIHAKPLFFVLVALPLLADPVPVRYPQGLLHGFLTLRSQDGAILASGGMNQTVKGNQVSNQLSFKFKDGSVQEETTVFSQSRSFRLLTHRLIQKGPAFKRPTDMSVNASSGQVSIRYTDDDGKEKTAEERMKLPTDLANGMVPTLLNNIAAATPKTTVSMVVSTPKPRLVKVEISPSGEEPFNVSGVTYKASRHVAKIDIGGISGVIAPIIGKQLPDTHLWIIRDSAPGFLKSEGPMCDGCPIWRIELASPTWPWAAPVLGPSVCAFGDTY